MDLPADKVEGETHFLENSSRWKNYSPDSNSADDATTREPAEQMACDEVLLTSSGGVPVLRLYRWGEPSATFGYAQRLEMVKASVPGLPLMRRWTGGGVVFHGRDLHFGVGNSHGRGRGITQFPGSLPIDPRGPSGGGSKILPNARLVEPEECRCGPVLFREFQWLSISFLNLQRFAEEPSVAPKAGVLYQGSLHLPGAVPLEIARSLTQEVMVFTNTASLETSAKNLVAGEIQPSGLARYALNLTLIGGVPNRDELCRLFPWLSSASQEASRLANRLLPASFPTLSRHGFSTPMPMQGHFSDSDPGVREAVVRDILSTAYLDNGKPDRDAIRKLVFESCSQGAP
jgi:hypothetical protein